MIDPAQIIWEWLTTSGTSLYTLCGTRIWAAEAPRQQARWNNQAPAIIFEVTAVNPHATAGALDCLVDFTCYGGDADAAVATYGNADAVYRALYDRLHGTRGEATATGQIMVAVQVGGQTGQREPETEWPFSAATYRITVIGALA